ncbi:Amino Acid-Polyamine-Organocation (APC) Family, partial [Phytophthora palmivora]
GGYTVWVLNALGPFWAFQTGYWAWVSGVLELSRSKVMSGISLMAAQTRVALHRRLLHVIQTLHSRKTSLTLLGIRIVGRGMAVMSVFVMIPFTVLFFWGVIRANDWGAVGEVRRADIVYNDNGDFVSMSGSIDIDWSLLINTLFWNFNGAVGMSVFGYPYCTAFIIPIIKSRSIFTCQDRYRVGTMYGATVFNSPHWTTWEEGSFSSIADVLHHNRPLDAFQILGMAECGLAPAFLAARNKQFNTPHNAVFASLVIILVLLPISKLKEFRNRESSVHSKVWSISLELTFVYKLTHWVACCHVLIVPGNIAVLIIALLVPTGLLIYIAVDVFFSLVPALLVVGMTLIGLLYARWRKFTRAQFRQLAANTES